MKCPRNKLKTDFCKSTKQDKCPEKAKRPHLHAIAKHLKAFKKGG